MQVSALYNQGRLEFPAPLHLKQQRFTVRVEIPDHMIAAPHATGLPEYDLAAFPPEIRERVARMTATAVAARHQPLPASPLEETADEHQRWDAVHFRAAVRGEAGRQP